MDEDWTYDSGNTLKRCVSDCEKALIIHVLLKTKGSLSLAAQLLGIKKNILTKKIHQYGIDCLQEKSKEKEKL